MSKQGLRIWEIDEKTGIPKEIFASLDADKLESMLRNEKPFDLLNKTYTIRIGKDGMK